MKKITLVSLAFAFLLPLSSFAQVVPLQVQPVELNLEVGGRINQDLQMRPSVGVAIPRPVQNQNINYNSGLRRCDWDNKIKLVLCNPDGGEKFKIGQTITVRWKTYKLIDKDKVVVELKNGEDKWIFLGSTTATDRSLSVKLPENLKPSVHNRIRITAFNQVGVQVGQDRSDGPFTLRK